MIRLFKVFIALLLAACVPTVTPPPVNTPQPLELGGVMLGETVLNGEYLLVSDLLIPEGSSLVIQPGTTILVRRAEFTKIAPEFLSARTELLVRGTIRINGSADAPVVFAPEQPSTIDDPGWAGLLLDGVLSSVVRHVSITGAETGLLLVAAEVELTDSHLEQNRYGLVIQGGAPLIERNRISAGETGLFVWRGATPTLKENVVLRNREEGIYIDRSSHPQLVANRSEQNTIGLVSVDKPDLDGLQLNANIEAWRKLPGRQKEQ